MFRSKYMKKWPIIIIAVITIVGLTSCSARRNTGDSSSTETYNLRRGNLTAMEGNSIDKER